MSPALLSPAGAPFHLPHADTPPAGRRYESAEAAQSCGAMLRECLRHEPLARIALFSEDFYRLFHYVALSVFDVASDAFASFKVGGSRPPRSAVLSHTFLKSLSLFRSHVFS